LPRSELLRREISYKGVFLKFGEKMKRSGVFERGEVARLGEV
jgi:hypothetical protein